MATPMMQFDPDGTAPLLRYDIPEPTSYSGRNGIALDIPEQIEGKATFLGTAYELREDIRRTPIDQLAEISQGTVLDALQLGDHKIFPNIKSPVATHASLFYSQTAVHNSQGTLDTATTSILAQALRARAVSPDLTALTTPSGGAAEASVQTNLPPALRASALADPALADQGVRPRISDLDAEHVTAQLRTGKRLNIFRSLWGEYSHSFLPEPTRINPQILLIETYRLSSFLGQFGAGRTLNTFSLLPGEKTTISVKTFRKSEVDSKSASSVLDSFTKESADDFENSLQSEQSDKQATQDSFEYHAEAEAQASWGWGSVSVSGGVKGGSASQREEFAKNVDNALNKHASKASSKRDVQVNTSSEVKTEAGEETSITRELENINVGRVVNFVFRQLNQEHIALLHLVDVRVAFWNGYAESAEEVPLPRLDALLEKYVEPDLRAEVRDIIIGQLSAIFDYQDQLVDPPVVEEKVISDGDKYLRFRKDLTSTYTDEAGNRITVPGVILSANKVVMRTEGVIVDGLIGQGNALDSYSQGLQENVVKQRLLENAERQARLDQEALARQIVGEDDQDKAKVFAQVFRDAVTLPGKITVSASDDGVTVAAANGAPGPGA